MHVRVQAVLNQFVEIRSPAPEVIVDINNRNARRFCAALERCLRARQRDCVRQQFFSTLEVDWIDHIDQQKYRLRFVRRMVQAATVLRPNRYVRGVCKIATE
jgi:hypothetical protein